MFEISLLIFVYWMLTYFFPKKKKERTNVTLNIDLNLVAFPDYPIGPLLKLETIQEDYFISRWQQKIAKWKEADAGNLWCCDMNNWFINHEFKSKEEVKVVVTYWLVKLEEVVVKGCLKIDEINVIVKAAEILLLLDNNNSFFNLDNMFILMSIIPNIKSKEEIENFIEIKKTEKQRLLEPQREAFETLKHNLEGIIEGNQNELLPIDTKNSELAKYFPSVCNDVREIWNKLQNQSIEKIIQGTTEHGKGNKPNKTEKTGNASPEVNKLKVEQGSLEVLQIQSKVDHTETVVPEANKGRNKVEHTEEVVPKVNEGMDKVKHTKEVVPEVNKGRNEVEYTERVVPEVNNGRNKVDYTERVVPEVSKKRGKVPLLEYKVLREHRVEMVNKLEPEKVIPYLIRYNVIDKDDVEMIEKKLKDLRRKGVETMLDILYNSGSWAFGKLIEALLNAGYQEMAKTLREDFEKKTANHQSVYTTEQKGALSQIEFEVLRDNHERLVNELDSSILKNHLFKNGLIDEDDLEKIGKKEGELRKEGAEEMVNIIHKSGANAFSKLLKSLYEAGYYELSSKLDTDLKQKKKEKTNEGKKFDLNLIAFPDYPILPQPSLEDIESDDDIHDWFKNLKEWNDTEVLWRDAMNSWFKDNKFYHKEEVKVVVKDWLLKLKEVVDKRCIGSVVTKILNAAEMVLKLHNNSSLHLKYNKEMLLKIIKRDILRIESMKEIEEYAQNKKAEKQIILKQHQQDFKTLKHSLEGIIEGNQNELLPIDTKDSELGKYFPSVCNDVREIWNKLQ